MLRVPITFPPDRFYGAELSAMCVPDLLGTQGTFLLYTTRPPASAFKEGGMRMQVTLDGDRIETALQGPGEHVRRRRAAADRAAARCDRSRRASGSTSTSAARSVDADAGTS